MMAGLVWAVAAGVPAGAQQAGQAAPGQSSLQLLGGLQNRSLRQELVGSGRMTPKQFHDTILVSGSMPIEMLRALLTNQRLTRDYRSQWRYYGDVAAGGR